jgi:hypothetical protein
MRLINVSILYSTSISCNIMNRTRIQYLCSLIIFSIVFMGCRTTYELKTGYRESWLFKAAIPKIVGLPKAFVLNPELSGEYDIFKKANLYDIVTDSSSSDVKIRLLRLEQRPACATGSIFVTMFSLGFWPVYFPDEYCFSYEEVTADSYITFHVPIIIIAKTQNFASGETDVEYLLAKGLHENVKGY